MPPNRQARLSGTDRRQQILEVAAEIFADQGYKGATTREIAEKARVNEAIIFRHFPSKEDLYWGVIEEMLSHGGRSHRELEERLNQPADLRQLLFTLASEILQRDTRLARLSLYSALENHKLSQRFFRTYVAKYYEVLAEHLRKRMEKGELRKMDPVTASRGFLGMIGNYFLVQEIYGGKRYQKSDPQRVAEEMTDIWLSGMLTNHGRKIRGAKGRK
ncbi:MAG TPA: TetR/AcrR family transcriptional regulator [Terriglobales bacterium]|jgi:AcrR family transcriptional regulator|nr:TetR/AcrR family transcriptional regulator [Terriglobales bacterium]